LLGLGARLRNTRVTDETGDVADAKTGIGKASRNVRRAPAVGEIFFRR